ncbi:MAG TPA: 2-hydroxychromene-2-carboxylate isomerase [Methyloversatilis sp.]
MNNPHIEFWFDFGSPYSHLSAQRIDTLARERGVRVLWQPMLLGPIFRNAGWSGSPFLQQPAKLAYMWTDIARQSAKYQQPWTHPSAFPRASLLPARIATAFGDEAWIGQFCAQVFALNFVHDKEIDSVDAMQRVLHDLGLPADTVIARAQTPEIKQALRDRTALGEQRGLFGAPSFLVGDALFWGNDRLEDALDAACNLPR